MKEYMILNNTFTQLSTSQMEARHRKQGRLMHNPHLPDHTRLCFSQSSASEVPGRCRDMREKIKKIQNIMTHRNKSRSKEREQLIVTEVINIFGGLSYVVHLTNKTKAVEE